MSNDQIREALEDAINLDDLEFYTQGVWKIAVRRHAPGRNMEFGCDEKSFGAAIKSIETSPIGAEEYVSDLFDWAHQNSYLDDPAEWEVEEVAAPSKGDVLSWRSSSSYVSTFESGTDLPGAVDVDVQIGEADGVWFVQTDDEAGGSDDATQLAFRSEFDAECYAEALAAERHEADVGESAESYISRILIERVQGADGLEALHEAVQTLAAHASKINERVEDLVDLSELPVWGPAPAGGTAGIWSWDSDSVLAGDEGIDSWQIKDRGDS